jgi:predicted transposase/invertase (TIGR01784 family)
MAFSKFLNPKNDFAFKAVFGSERNQAILIHFINDLLDLNGDAQVKTVSLIKTSQDPEIAAKKQSLIDVLCTDQQERRYIIEMQLARMKGFEKRAQYYASKAYSRQLNQGEGYELLNEVIFIAITDFVMFPDKQNYYSKHCLLDNETYTNDLKGFSFRFLELPKFNKSIDELTNRIEKWSYFLKHAQETCEEDLPQIVGSDSIILKAYEALNRYSWSESELDAYEQEEKRQLDEKAAFEQGMLEAEARGVAIGETRGEMKNAAAMLRAVELLLAGHSFEHVVQETGLNQEILESLQAKMQLKT